MKKLILPLIFIVMSISCRTNPGNSEADVAAAVELLRKTIVQPDQAIFEKLTAETLSYGHSAGLIEDRSTFISSLVTGKYKFLSIDASDQTIDVQDIVAIVRHSFSARTHDQGKEPNNIRLKVLQVWHKENGNWRLLARQAVKIL